MTRADLRAKYGLNGGVTIEAGYPSMRFVADVHLTLDHYEAQLAEKDKRIAELEAKNAEHAKPKFEVGQTVEWDDLSRRMYGITGKITNVTWAYQTDSTDGYWLMAEENIRPSQPKVTKPTADEWYEAFCGEQNGDFKEMVKLARRHEATQTEEAK